MSELRALTLSRTPTTTTTTEEEEAGAAVAHGRAVHSGKVFRTFYIAGVLPIQAKSAKSIKTEWQHTIFQ